MKFDKWDSWKDLNLSQNEIIRCIHIVSLCVLVYIDPQWQKLFLSSTNQSSVDSPLLTDPSFFMNKKMDSMVIKGLDSMSDSNFKLWIYQWTLWCVNSQLQKGRILCKKNKKVSFIITKRMIHSQLKHDFKSTLIPFNKNKRMRKSYTVIVELYKS